MNKGRLSISIAVVCILAFWFSGAGAYAPSPKPAVVPPAPEAGAEGPALQDTAPQTSGFSLDDCIRFALENNNRLKGAGYAIEAAKGQLAEAKAAYWPILEYTYRLAPVPTDVNNAFKRFFDWQVTLYNSFHVGVAVPVMTFGQLHEAKKIATNGVAAAREEEIKVREGTIYQVKQLYYGIQLAKEMKKLLEEADKKMGEKIADEEAKVKKDMDPYDLMKIKLFRVDVQRRLGEAHTNLEIAEEGLRLQMGLDPDEKIILDSDHLKPVIVSFGDERDYIDAAMQFQPDVQLLDIGVDVRKSQYRLEKFKLLPAAAVGFFTDVGRTTGFVAGVTATGDYNDPFNYTRAGVGLQFKGTIDFHGAYGRIKKARAEYYKASFDRLFARRGLALDIRKAFIQTKRMRDDVARAKKAEAIARQMAFISKVNIDMGIGDSQKYGDALAGLLLMRATYFKSVFDYNTAQADLAQRIGVAKAEELMPPAGVAEYEAFDTDSEEGLITLEGPGDNGGSGSKNKNNVGNPNKGAGNDDNLE
ncbi:MAG: TolC family protein [Pseudomonadota bacterium]